MARLRQDETREIVRSYFAAALDRYVERMNDTGLSERSLENLRNELDIHEDAIGGFEDLSDLYLDTGVSLPLGRGGTNGMERGRF